MITQEQLNTYRDKLTSLEKLTQKDEDDWWILLNNEYPELVENLLKELEKVVTGSKFTKSSSDKELYEKMKSLIEVADKQVSKWREEKRDVDWEDYENYQSYIYGKIWDKFWKLHKEISVDIDWYDPDTTYYEDIMACFNAYKEIEWMFENE